MTTGSSSTDPAPATPTRNTCTRKLYGCAIAISRSRVRHYGRYRTDAQSSAAKGDDAPEAKSDSTTTETTKTE